MDVWWRRDAAAAAADASLEVAACRSKLVVAAAASDADDTALRRIGIAAAVVDKMVVAGRRTLVDGSHIVGANPCRPPRLEVVWEVEDGRQRLRASVAAASPAARVLWQNLAGSGPVIRFAGAAAAARRPFRARAFLRRREPQRLYFPFYCFLAIRRPCCSVVENHL